MPAVRGRGDAQRHTGPAEAGASSTALLCVARLVGIELLDNFNLADDVLIQLVYILRRNPPLFVMPGSHNVEFIANCEILLKFFRLVQQHVEELRN